MNPFGRIMSAMITPFDMDGKVDLAVARDLASYLVKHGNDGLVVCGTTGESPTLSDAETLDLIEAVVDAVDVPVVAGTVGNDTAHSIELSRQAAKLGVAGILSLCPYYSRPSQAGIEAHLRAIAAMVDLPQILYDIPVRTGRKIEYETLLRLANEVENIVAVKDAAGNPGASARLIANTRDEFNVISGDDALTLPLLAVGAVGVIGVATHWTGPDHVEMFDAFERGDIETARRVNARMVESFAFESGDEAPNPIPTKAMMRYLGFAVGQARLPVGDAPEWVAHRAQEVWANLEAARG